MNPRTNALYVIYTFYSQSYIKYGLGVGVGVGVISIIL